VGIFWEGMVHDDGSSITVRIDEGNNKKTSKEKRRRSNIDPFKCNRIMMFLRYDLPLRFRPTENVSGNLEISRYRNQRLRSFQSRNITPVIQESQESPQNDSRISSNQDSNLFLRNAVPLITSWILNERNARNYISFFRGP